MCYSEAQYQHQREIPGVNRSIFNHDVIAFYLQEYPEDGATFREEVTGLDMYSIAATVLADGRTERRVYLNGRVRSRIEIIADLPRYVTTANDYFRQRNLGNPGIAPVAAFRLGIHRSIGLLVAVLEK